MNEFLFFFHLIALFLSSFFIYFFLYSEKLFIEKIVFAYLILWSNLIVTAVGLSTFAILNSKIAYITVSLFLNIGLLALCYRKDKFVTLKGFSNPSFRFIFTNSFYFTLLALIFLLQIIICYNYLPQIPDTLSSKLVKIYAYLEHGRMLPNKNFDGGLIFGAPLNTSATWLIFVIHSISLKSLYFFTLFNWVIIGFASYLLCIKLKISKKSSLIATILFVCSDLLILNSTSEGDDIIACSSFVISILSFVYWYFDRKKIYATFSGLALGISLGIKPFAALYFLLILSLILFFLFKFGIRQNLSFLRIYSKDVILFGMGTLVALSGVFYENFHERGNPLQFSKILVGLRNSPFDFKTAGINLATQNMELFLGPVFLPTGVSNRELLSQKANDSAKRFIDSTFNTNQEEVFLKYSAHQNRTTIASSQYYDHGGNFGFYPHLLVLFFLLSFYLPKKNYLIIILGISFIFADIGYCISNKYIATIMRYWMIIFTITTPLIGYILDKKHEFHNQYITRFINSAVYSILIYTIYSAFYGLFNNSYRSMNAVLSGQTYNSYVSNSFEIFTHVLELIKKLKRANIIYLHNYPIAILQYLGNPTLFISKVEIVPEIPNILIAQQINLGVLDYSHSPRYIDIEVDGIEENNFQFIGNYYSSKIYINNLPEPLRKKNQKNSLLFVVSQSHENKFGKLESVSYLISKLNNPNQFEVTYSVLNKDMKEVELFPWDEFKTRIFAYDKSDKFLILKVRNKETKKTYENKYPI
jgi:hypothetical protein